MAKDGPTGTKWCPRCEQYLALSRFNKSSTRKDGLTATCKPCSADYQHEHRISKVFGLSAEEYDSMLDLQEGRCAICLQKPRTRRLAVDHDHKTGEVRGLLCNKCNHRILGSAHEDPAVLRRAARYLEGPSRNRPSLHGESAILRVECELEDLATSNTGLPIVVHRPDGMGPASIENWPATLRLSDLVRLLRAAGYGDPEKEEGDDQTGHPENAARL